MAGYKVINTPFYVVTVFSLTLLLVVMGWTLTSFVLSGNFMTSFKEQINIIAELDEKANNREAVISFLKKHPQTIGTSVRYISKEVALSSMEAELGSSILSEGMENPFQEVVQFNMKADALTLANLDELEKTLKKDLQITGMFYPADLFSGVQRTFQSISMYGAIFVLILLTIVIFLIHQIIKMNIISNRFVIRTMEMVGATPSFIRKPFRSEGLKIGFISATMAIILYGISIFLIPEMSQLTGFSLVNPTFLVICAFLMAISVGICLISSRMALSKYLNVGIDKYH